MNREADRDRREAPLTTLPASRIIGIPPDTLRYWARERRIRCMKTESGQYLFARGDCERAAEERRRA